MTESNLGCGVCDYKLVPCDCILDCVSEAVCCSPEKRGWREGFDKFPDVCAVQDVSGERVLSGLRIYQL